MGGELSNVNDLNNSTVYCTSSIIFHSNCNALCFNMNALNIPPRNKFHAMDLINVAHNKVYLSPIKKKKKTSKVYLSNKKRKKKKDTIKCSLGLGSRAHLPIPQNLHRILNSNNFNLTISYN